jgi:glycerol-3-phosphate dehydrogenase
MPPRGVPLVKGSHIVVPRQYEGEHAFILQNEEDRGRACPWLPLGHLRALARRHGTRIDRVIGEARSIEDMGKHFGAGLYAREVDLLLREEWAAVAKDVLFCRTKLGLHMNAGE